MGADMRLVEHIHATVRHKRPDLWPAWCYVPVDVVVDATDPDGEYRLEAEAEDDGRKLEANLHFAMEAVGLAAWRMTKGVYRFDPDLFDAVWSTPITKELPGEVLRHLPEWCVYIPTPGKRYEDADLHGFFAYLDHDALRRTRKHLVLLLHTSEKHLTPIMVALSASLLGGIIEGDLESIVTASSPRIRAHLKAQMEGGQGMLRRAVMIRALQATAEHTREVVTPLVSLVLYLCAVNRDVQPADGSDRAPRNPRPKPTKKGHKTFAAQTPAVWRVGYRVGTDLRRARQDTNNEAGSGGGSGTKKAPHLRRAHFHHYWTGPRKDPARRQLILKWLDPMLINAGAQDPDETPVVLHRVLGDDT